MELLSPAGTLEKLRYAYAYGADAAYVGLRDFSLRSNAGNIDDSQLDELNAIKGNKRLYAAINSLMHQRDIAVLRDRLDAIARYPFDAFIVSDMGAGAILKRRFPDRALHLSTQASCLNSAAVAAYRDMGFSRIVLGREASLEDIATIKEAVPEVELEVFVHGAMCMAYSGRCFLSAFLAGRSANSGDCAHSCRWDYRLREQRFALEESERPGQYYPVFEEDGQTTILSSKDLCMIDHLAQIKAAGVDSVKIEGRMKSLYYTATVTRAYRKALDSLEGQEGSLDWKAYRDELFHVSHREFSTGFFFGPQSVEKPTESSYLRDYLFVATLGPSDGTGLYPLFLKNPIDSHDTIEFIGPDTLAIEDHSFTLHDAQGAPVERLNHHQAGFIRPSVSVGSDFIIRKQVGNGQ